MSELTFRLFKKKVPRSAKHGKETDSNFAGVGIVIDCAGDAQNVAGESLMCSKRHCSNIWSFPLFRSFVRNDQQLLPLLSYFRATRVPEYVFSWSSLSFFLHHTTLLFTAFTKSYQPVLYGALGLRVSTKSNYTP